MTIIPVNNTGTLTSTMQRYHLDHNYNKPATILIVAAIKVSYKEQQLLMCAASGDYFINGTSLTRIMILKFIAFQNYHNTVKMRCHLPA